MKKIIKRATSSEIGKILYIMEEVASKIDSSDLFFADGMEYITDHIENCGMTYIAEIDGQYAGFIIIDIPEEKPHNLGLDLKLPEDRLLTSAHMDSIAVLPRFRGLNLQKDLLRHSEAELKPLGYTDFLATVHPNNAASLKSFLGVGYEIKDTKLKYGGFLRHILQKYKNEY